MASIHTRLRNQHAFIFMLHGLHEREIRALEGEVFKYIHIHVNFLFKETTKKLLNFNKIMLQNYILVE